jgi:pyruvate dehydrogenase E2 component (dihydrolipoamide acetyltransferase)
MAIAEFPVFRRSLRGEQVVDHGVIDIAVALGVGEELFAPVVRGPGAKSVAEISREIGSFKERAGSHSRSARDTEASCFLVSNLGMFPIEGFDAIIYPEHSAALAVAAVIRTPVAVGESVQIAPLARLTLSVDHRLINGATAARFLTRVKQILENGELA